MCTLAIAWQALEDAPIAVAANRDESLGRPSEPPGRYGDDPVVVAPRDVEAGGTWIGINERGVFAGVTNRWSDVELPGERSRGLLVADALACESADAAADVVADETDRLVYDPFYLVLADVEGAMVLGWDGDLERWPLDAGVHVVVNVGHRDAYDVPSVRSAAAERQAESARQVREALCPASAERGADWLDRAGDVLGDHEYGVCVHGDGYGTRSSSLIELGDRTRYRFADGHPCRAAYETVDVEGHI